MSASPTCSKVAEVAGTVVEVAAGAAGSGVGSVGVGFCAEPEGSTGEDWATIRPGHTRTAIRIAAGSGCLSNLRIFPPYEGIEATNLHHRLLELEHLFVQHRQACLRRGCKAD